MTDATALCARLRERLEKRLTDADTFSIEMTFDEVAQTLALIESQAREIEKWKERASEVEDGLTIAYMQGASAQDDHWRPRLSAAESRTAALEEALRKCTTDLGPFGDIARAALAKEPRE